MEPSDRNRYHPGTCEATSWGKRYGKYKDPQVFDGFEHQWHLAKDKNWGPWSCCDGVANSLGCCERRGGEKEKEKRECEEKKYIQFLEKGNIVGVVSEEEKCWRLDDGRIAKKKTEGQVWKWHDGSLLGCEKGGRKKEEKKCGTKKYIQFLEKGNIVGVVSEEEKCWRLNDGRIAKKKTEGTVWRWHNKNRVTKKKTKEGKAWKYHDGPIR